MVTKRTPEKREWHLVCVTRLGRVSMLKQLTLREARQTYQKLMPGEHPKTYKLCRCEKCKGNGGWSEWGRSYGPNDDWLEKVEAIGPERMKLEPWKGVKPDIIDKTHLCPDYCSPLVAKIRANHEARKSGAKTVKSAAWTGRD